MRTELTAVDEPAGTRDAYWHDVVGSVFPGLTVRLDEPADVRDSFVHGVIGPLQVVESRSGPGEAFRTTRHLRGAGADQQHYALYVQDVGTAVGEHNDHTAEFRPGDVGLVDLGRPLRCVYTARRAVMVTYPKDLCPLRPDELADLAGTRFDRADGTAALVSSLVRRLPDHLDVDDGTGGARIGNAVLDLVNVGLAAQVDRHAAVPARTRDNALLVRCKAFIETNLGDTALGPRTIAAAHHVSVRNLHRVFEATGDGVAGWIRRRRLDKCRRDLLDPDLAARPVSAIGARWGFRDAAHFTRAFKATYGLPPAEFRATYAG